MKETLSACLVDSSEQSSPEFHVALAAKLGLKMALQNYNRPFL